MTLRRAVQDCNVGWSVAGLTMFVILLLSVAAAYRGPSLDELWTMWMTRPGLSIPDIARERWFQDTHPPLFYFLNWSIQPIIGPSLFAHRIGAILAVAYLALVSLYLARTAPSMRAMMAVTWILMLSNRDFIYFVEYRSYLWTLCASAAIVFLLYRVTTISRDFDSVQDRRLAMIIALAILLALNIHYFGSMICGLALAVVAADQIRVRRWRWATILVVAAGAAMIPLLAAFAAELPYMRSTVPDFWVRTEAWEAVGFLFGKVTASLSKNVIAAACAALLLFRLVARRASAPEDANVEQWRFAILMGIAVGTVCLILIVASMFKPVVVPRYLIALTPLCISGLSALLSSRLVSRSWLFALFLLNAAIVVVPPALREMDNLRWYDSAALVGRQVRACPGTIVYATSRHDAPPPTGRKSVPNFFEVYEWAMRHVGRQFGFDAVFVRRAPPGTVRRRSVALCPTLVWIEHSYYTIDHVGVVRAIGLPISDAEVARVVGQRTGSGHVISVPPLQP